MQANLLGTQSKLQILEDTRYKLNKGDIVLVADSNILFICCPQCGEGSFTSTHKIQNNSSIITVTPSIQMYCCDWHGYLTDNEFKKV